MEDGGGGISSKKEKKKEKEKNERGKRRKERGILREKCKIFYRRLLGCHGERERRGEG